MSEKKRIVTFANTEESAPDPVAANEKVRFRDLTFVPELRNKVCKWDGKTNWVRYLPPIQGSSYQWMLRIELLQAPEGQGDRLPTFVHPKSFDRAAQSPFDEAYQWYRANAKEELYHREKNRNGVKLNSKSAGVAWMIHTGKEAGEKLGLFCSSLYDGAWGGTPGLAYKIWMEANQVDTEPNSPTYQEKVYPNITAPAAGNLILVEKHKPESGDRYSTYVVRVGKTAAPVEQYLQMLSDEEHNLIVPLEKTIYVPTLQEQHQMLREYIGSSRYQSIFGDGSAIGTASPLQDQEQEQEVPETLATRKQESAPKDVAPVQEPAPAQEPKAQAEVAKPAAEVKKPAAPAEPAAEKKVYGIREVSQKLSTEDGVIELLQNYDALPASQKTVLIEVAKDMGIDTTKYLKSADSAE